MTDTSRTRERTIHDDPPEVNLRLKVKRLEAEIERLRLMLRCQGFTDTLIDRWTPENAS